MPDFTIASAMPRTSWSLTSHQTLFLVSPPRGGVRASPADTEVDCANIGAGNWKGIATARVNARRKCFVMVRLEGSDHHTAEYLSLRIILRAASQPGNYGKDVLLKAHRAPLHSSRQ